VSIPKKQFQKLQSEFIEIPIGYPTYDGDLYESIKFEHEMIIDDEIEIVINGFANFKFDSVVDDIFGRECEHIDFDIDTIKVYKENGNQSFATEFQENKIKGLLIHTS
jgi:hypothetical protein